MMPALVTRQFPASADSLVLTLHERVDESILEEIALADYGLSSEQHLAPLLSAWRARKTTVSLGWHPGEVLELIRWSMPDDPSWQPSLQGERGHLARAYACALLLRSGGDTYRDETLAPLIVSALRLGGEIPSRLGCFLSWRTAEAHEIDRPVLAIALLCLLIADEAFAPPEEYREVVNWFWSLDRAAFEWESPRHPPVEEPWLLDTLVNSTSRKHWIDIGAQLAPQFERTLGDEGERLTMLLLGCP